jgi:hypothetical protein
VTFTPCCICAPIYNLPKVLEVSETVPNALMNCRCILLLTFVPYFWARCCTRHDLFLMFASRLVRLMFICLCEKV